MSKASRMFRRSLRTSPVRRKVPVTYCRMWKNAYATERKALEVARHREKESGVRLRAYACGNHWHLTSRQG